MKHIKLYEDSNEESLTITVEDLKKAFQDLASECLSNDGTIVGPADAFKWIESKIDELKK